MVNGLDAIIIIIIIIFINCNWVVTGAFAKLRKATIRFVMPVCPSALNNSAPTGWIFMRFDF